jgi:hypothetical protein
MEEMLENFRTFTATDPFGRTWQVEFRWLQNAISIRHSDSVDLKYYISDGEEKREIVMALPHPDLVALARSQGRALTDAWCLQMAGLHLEGMIRTWTDMENTIVTVPARDLAHHHQALKEAAEEAARRAELYR